MTDEQNPSGAAVPSWLQGDTIWHEGDQVRPVRVQSGIVAYRRGCAALGLLGPGQVVPPTPGFGEPGVASTDLIALTDVTLTEVDPTTETLQPEELRVSVDALINGFDRLANMLLPQRLAAILLEISDLTGQNVVPCRQALLAIAAASRRETTALILGQWRDQEWIRTRYRRVIIADRDALIRIREGQE